MNDTVSRRVAATCAAVMLVCAPLCAAQSAPKAPAWPTKPVRMVVASGPGGGLDYAARLVATPLTEYLGQSVVVDNRAGASGSIAAEITAFAPRDGYTLMVLSASLVVYGIVNKTRYDLFTDFTPVSQLAASPYFLTVHPTVPAKSVKEFVAYAKANPNKINFASTGNASLAHLAGELFAMQTGTNLLHVPYKGVGAALTDLLSGQVHMSLLSGGSILAQVRSQKLRALAVASTQRVKIAPELPTIIESGVPGYAVTQWHGIMAPSGTPRPIIDRLHREIVRAIQSPDVANRLATDGTDGIASTPEQFGAHLKAERDQWARVAKVAKIRAD